MAEKNQIFSSRSVNMHVSLMRIDHAKQYVFLSVLLLVHTSLLLDTNPGQTNCIALRHMGKQLLAHKELRWIVRKRVRYKEII